MGRYSAYKLFFAAVAVFILALPLSSSAYDMQKGMTDADKSVYIEAHEHFSAERYSKAAESVMEHMKNPAVKKHGIFYLLLGNIMTKTGRGQEAYSYYAGAAEFYGDNPDLYVQAGLAAYSNDRTKEAAEMMKKAVGLGTENQQAYRVLASSAFDEKRYEEAAEVLRQMKQKETQDYKLLLYIYAVSGDIKSARHLLNHLSRHTVQSKWWKLYGLYMVDRNLEEAAAAFRVYIRTEEPPEKELRMISGVLAGQRVYDEAYELLSRIDDPTCSDRLELGKLALKLGKTEESEQLLKDALEKKCHRRSGLLLAHLYYRTARYGESAEMFERYAERPGHIYMAALACYKTGDFEKAEQLLSRIKTKKLTAKVNKLLKIIGEKNDG